MRARDLFLVLLLLGFGAGGWGAAYWLWQKPVPVPEGRPLPTASPVGGALAMAFDEAASGLLREGAAVGFCVLDDRGEPLYASPLAGTVLSPASALKTLTTAAALETLGPEFQFETRLAAANPPDADGRLEGNLVLVGGGDPTFTTSDLEKMVARLDRLEVITGDLRVDAGIFPPNPVSDHWNWGDIGNAYGAGAFGLNLNRNTIVLSFRPGPDPGTPAPLLARPQAMDDFEWRNHVVTGPAGSGDQTVVYAEPYGRRVTLRGTVPAGAPEFAVRAALPDPPAVALGLLRRLLTDRGIRILGAEVSPAKPDTTLASHLSAPLAEIIDHLHEVSDNLEAQALFLTLGNRAGTDPVEAVTAHWQGRGVRFEGLRLIDGSGLARANAIRPLDLARVNFTARRGPEGARYHESLNPSADGAVRAKAGAMSGVRSDVGFVTTADGRERTYALIANGLRPDADFGAVRARLLEAAAAP